MLTTYARYSRKNHKYEEGEQFGLLTLIRKDTYLGGVYGDRQLHEGWWIARCECGAEVRVHTSWMCRGLRGGFGCRACPSQVPKKLRGPRKQRSDIGKSRPHYRRKNLFP